MATFKQGSKLVRLVVPIDACAGEHTWTAMDTYRGNHSDQVATGHGFLEVYMICVKCWRYAYVSPVRIDKTIADAELANQH